VAFASLTFACLTLASFWWRSFLLCSQAQDPRFKAFGLTFLTTSSWNRVSGGVRASRAIYGTLVRRCWRCDAWFRGSCTGNFHHRKNLIPPAGATSSGDVNVAAIPQCVLAVGPSFGDGSPLFGPFSNSHASLAGSPLLSTHQRGSGDARPSILIWWLMILRRSSRAIPRRPQPGAQPYGKGLRVAATRWIAISM